MTHHRSAIDEIAGRLEDTDASLTRRLQLIAKIERQLLALEAGPP